MPAIFVRLMLISALVLLAATSGGSAGAVPPDAKADTAASAGAVEAMKGFQMPEGFEAQLFAAEPLLINPVAFAIDEQGRVYVAETDRVHKGVSDNRNSMFWLDDDIAADTVEDRLAIYQKWAVRRPMEWYTSGADTVRIVLDNDGDGRADEAKLFAGPFNEPLDGLGSGLMALRGNVYFTNIPHLWKLADTDGDHRADVKQTLSSGYGVRTAFLGHDLHGLTLGPDGRIYFSVGDRGYNVPLPDGSGGSGARLRDPMNVGRGAVFRCEPDGSNLEVFYRGLRNPQELAFDHFGNLFTGDNNSDAGDQARIVYLVEGGDSGWAMTYQYLEGDYSRGPWHAEKIWHTRGDDQLGRPAAYLPPLAHLTNGPSGFVHYPGTGLPERYDGHFFLADFKGTPANSGVYSFALKSDGAGYKLDDVHKFIWNVLATDVDFGYDGKVYVSDWINGWRGEGAGRIYTYFHPRTIQSEAVSSAKRLFAEGIETLIVDEPAGLLRHDDYRVRLRAHLALAEKGAVEQLAAAAKQTEHRMARLHGVWGLGIVSRGTLTNQARSRVTGLAAAAKRGGDYLDAYLVSMTKRPASPAFAAIAHVLRLLSDADEQVRANAVRALSEVSQLIPAEMVLPLLDDASPRVRMLAAITLGEGKDPAAVASLIKLARENDDKDVFLRHGMVMGLTGCADVATLDKLRQDSSAAVRRVAVLALRRKQSPPPELAHFLRDRDITVAAEAARAIYDMNIEAAMPALAAVLQHDFSRSAGQADDGDFELASRAFLRRAIAANHRLGTAEAADRLASFAAAPAPGSNDLMRREALVVLAEIATPQTRDRVLNFHRPLPAREPALVRDALQRHIKAITSTSKGDLQADAVRIAAKFGVSADDDLLVRWVGDEKQDASLRIESLNSLADRKHPRTMEAIDAALASGVPGVRAAARDALVQIDPARALKELAAVVQEKQPHGHAAAFQEIQRAYAALAALQSDAADALIAAALDQLIAGDLDPAVHLDVIEAAKQRPALAAKLETLNAKRSASDPLAAYRPSLHGGDAGRGRVLFEGHLVAQCMRCHKIDNNGGEAGPDLTKIGERATREHLLESLVNPSAAIAPGYGMVVLTLQNGQVVAGTLRSEEAGTVTLVTPDNKTQALKKTDIASQTPAISAMPPMPGILTPAEMRDVIEYLARRK